MWWLHGPALEPDHRSSALAVTLHLSGPQFFHGENNHTYHAGLLRGMNGSLYWERLESCLAQRRPSENTGYCCHLPHGLPRQAIGLSLCKYHVEKKRRFCSQR